MYPGAYHTKNLLVLDEIGTHSFPLALSKQLSVSPFITLDFPFFLSRVQYYLQCSEYNKLESGKLLFKPEVLVIDRGLFSSKNSKLRC